jgi:hypothetical protein
MSSLEFVWKTLDITSSASSIDYFLIDWLEDHMHHLTSKRALHLLFRSFHLFESTSRNQFVLRQRIPTFYPAFSRFRCLFTKHTISKTNVINNYNLTSPQIQSGKIHTFFEQLSSKPNPNTSLFIQTQSTPNPETMKFIPGNFYISC